MTNNSQRIGWDIERSVAGPAVLVYVTCGPPLTVNPRIIVFDNQSAVSVTVSVDGVNPWKTFEAGQSFVLDCTANHGIASNYTSDLGTQFYVSTPGTGFFISINYAR